MISSNDIFTIAREAELYVENDREGNKNDKSAKSVMKLKPDLWYHVAAVYNAADSSYAMYVNGKGIEMTTQGVPRS